MAAAGVARARSPPRGRSARSAPPGSWRTRTRSPRTTATTSSTSTWPRPRAARWRAPAAGRAPASARPRPARGAPRARREGRAASEGRRGGRRGDRPPGPARPVHGHRGRLLRPALAQGGLVPRLPAPGRHDDRCHGPPGGRSALPPPRHRRLRGSRRARRPRAPAWSAAWGRAASAWCWATRSGASRSTPSSPQGIENIAWDSQTGLRLRHLRPHRQAQGLPVERLDARSASPPGPPPRGTRSRASPTRPGRLLWAALGDPAFLPGPYGAGPVPHRAVPASVVVGGAAAWRFPRTRCSRSRAAVSSARSAGARPRRPRWSTGCGARPPTTTRG